MYRRLLSLVVLLLLAAGAIGQQKPAESGALPSEETVNSFLKATFGYDPTLTWKITSVKPSEAAGLAEVDVLLSGSQGSQAQKFYVTPDNKHVVIGDILPFGAHPFAEDQKVLEKGVNGPSRGPANAPVTLVEFSDLQCPHCKDAQPNVEKLLAEDKNVRVVFQSFPLPMHDWAMKGALYADCVAHASNDAFWKFIDGIFAAQSDITASNANEKLTGLADAAGVKGSEIAVCAAKPETTTRVEQSENLGKKMEVNSTPTFFINGRRVPGVPYETLQKLVDFAVKGQ
jgi:protein-disulfide isomerase